MFSTAGDPLIGYAYLSVALISALFQIWIDEKSSYFFKNLTSSTGGIFPGFILFYKAHSPTPLIFIFSGFSAMSSLDCLRFRRIYWSRLCLSGPYPCHCPPSVRSIVLRYWFFQAYFLGSPFRFSINCPRLCRGFNHTSLAARLIGNYFFSPVLRIRLVV